MATSAVDLCNQALSGVPAKHIVSLHDNTKAARECRTHFTQALEEVLESGEWSFQTKRVRLTQIVMPQKGWRNAFQGPADMAFPLRIIPSEDPEGWRKWEGMLFDWEGQRFWVNADEAWLEYVSKTPNYEAMPASFRKAVIDTLCSRLIVPITGNDQRAQAKLQQAEVFRDRANANNLNTNPTENVYGTAAGYMPSTLRGFGEGW